MPPYSKQCAAELAIRVLTNSSFQLMLGYAVKLLTQPTMSCLDVTGMSPKTNGCQVIGGIAYYAG